ncbi:hypothetical protein ACFV4F_04595 [Kitasatospora sp. NPDC059722]|uniref:hypothetical protein n=1 Tax=Kitasatospora sp. NPDC059722 TaxID=3346925 RepID=UPI0036B85276
MRHHHSGNSAGKTYANAEAAPHHLGTAPSQHPVLEPANGQDGNVPLQLVGASWPQHLPLDHHGYFFGGSLGTTPVRHHRSLQLREEQGHATKVPLRTRSGTITARTPA